MKHFITIIALAAAAAAQAQGPALVFDGPVTFTAEPSTARGYMVNDVATYDMLWRRDWNQIVRLVVVGCDKGSGTIQNISSGPKHPWVMHGKGVNDQLATETCAAGLVWLRQGGKF